ncbi:hypothetical protein EDC04DRAFT_253746 [Pisolithus marmoratus]|nr:hypothetical protein EDC04DRAFT_253746 [Pisolithus marmoratus]
MRSMHLLQHILVLSLSVSPTKAFSTTVGIATECAPLDVSWTGGQSPFEISIFLVSNSAIFYPVPCSSNIKNCGSYTIPQLPFPQGQQFVLTMSDATGFAVGGTTDVITVAASMSNSSCNTTVPSPSFTFNEAMPSLEQCGMYIFDGYQGAILPVTFLGIVPGGESFVLQSAVTTMSYAWMANPLAESSIIFSMLDSQNNTGGCSVIQTVGKSNYALCSSPTISSAASIPQSSQSGSSTLSTSQTASGSSANLSTATIAGIAGGGGVALAVLVFLAVCLIHRTRRNDSTRAHPTPHSALPLFSGELDHDYRLSYQGASYQPVVPSNQTIPRVTHPAPQSTHSLPRTSINVQGDPSASTNTLNFAAYNDTGISSVPSLACGKRSMVVLSPSGLTRYITHMDAEDIPPTSSQVIELPPQYPERLGLDGSNHHQGLCRQELGIETP